MPTYDSHYIFSFLYHTRSGKDGGWNATRYSNPDIDKAIQGLTGEIDIGQAQRDDRQDLEDAERRDDLHRPASPDAGLRHEERPRHPGVAGQLGVHEVHRSRSSAAVSEPGPLRPQPRGRVSDAGAAR